MVLDSHWNVLITDRACADLFGGDLVGANMVRHPPSAILYIDRLGDDLTPDARRRALDLLAASTAEANPAHITWEQVQAAAQI
jgi:hypothetical protein